jgi:acetoin utilization protein AcuB
MLISEILQADVVTVAPDTPLAQVLQVLNRRRVRHVPVVEAERLVGIISDRDIKSALAPSLGPGGRTAGQIMTREPITIAPMFPVEEAARVMVTNRISALPVVEGTRLVGIVTETDLLEVLSRAMGALEPSSRLDIAVTGGAQAVDDVIRTVAATGARISSLMTWSARTDAQDIAIRLATIDPGPAIRALEAKGYAVRDSWRGPRRPGDAPARTPARDEARP